MKKSAFLRLASILNTQLEIIPLLFGSLGLEQRLLRHGVKASMHIFPSGGHSMKKNDEERCQIILDWLDWLGMTKE